MLMALRRLELVQNWARLEKAYKIRRNDTFVRYVKLSESGTIVWGVAFPH
jgi:hypothetical protein